MRRFALNISQERSAAGTAGKFTALPHTPQLGNRDGKKGGKREKKEGKKRKEGKE